MRAVDLLEQWNERTGIPGGICLPPLPRIDASVDKAQQGRLIAISAYYLKFGAYLMQYAALPLGVVPRDKPMDSDSARTRRGVGLRNDTRRELQVLFAMRALYLHIWEGDTQPWLNVLKPWMVHQGTQDPLFSGNELEGLLGLVQLPDADGGTNDWINAWPEDVRAWAPVQRFLALQTEKLDQALEITEQHPLALLLPFDSAWFTIYVEWHVLAMPDRSLQCAYYTGRFLWRLHFALRRVFPTLTGDKRAFADDLCGAVELIYEKTMLWLVMMLETERPISSNAVDEDETLIRAYAHEVWDVIVAALNPKIYPTLTGILSGAPYTSMLQDLKNLGFPVTKKRAVFRFLKLKDQDVPNTKTKKIKSDIGPFFALNSIQHLRGEGTFPNGTQFENASRPEAFFATWRKSSRRTSQPPAPILPPPPPPLPSGPGPGQVDDEGNFNYKRAGTRPGQGGWTLPKTMIPTVVDLDPDDPAIAPDKEMGEEKKKKKKKKKKTTRDESTPTEKEEEEEEEGGDVAQPSAKRQRRSEPVPYPFVHALHDEAGGALSDLDRLLYAQYLDWLKPVGHARLIDEAVRRFHNSLFPEGDARPRESTIMTTFERPSLVEGMPNRLQDALRARRPGVVLHYAEADPVSGTKNTYTLVLRLGSLYSDALVIRLLDKTRFFIVDQLRTADAPANVEVELNVQVVDVMHLMGLDRVHQAREYVIDAGDDHIRLVTDFAQNRTHVSQILPLIAHDTPTRTVLAAHHPFESRQSANPQGRLQLLPDGSIVQAPAPPPPSKDDDAMDLVEPPAPSNDDAPPPRKREHDDDDEEEKKRESKRRKLQQCAGLQCPRTVSLADTAALHRFWWISPLSQRYWCGECATRARTTKKKTS